MTGGLLRARIRWLPHGVGLPLPCHASPGAAGADLCAAVPEAEPFTLQPGARALIPCGFAIEIPPGFEAQVRPRSGWALKHGITVLNSPGTIDSDYRGEVGALLINYGGQPFAIRRGDRVAQMVIAPFVFVAFEVAKVLTETNRGVGGFGSTGAR